MKMMKPLLALAAVGLLAAQSVMATQPAYGVLVPFNFTSTVSLNTNVNDNTPVYGGLNSPLTTVSVGNKDLIKLLNASSAFTDYLYWYTSGAENYLPSGTVFYLDLEAGNDQTYYETNDGNYFDGNYSSVVVSNKFGIVPLEYYDPEDDTYYYDFMEFDITGVQGAYNQKTAGGQDNEKDLLNVELFFDDYNSYYNYGNGNYFALSGTGSLSLVANSSAAQTGVGFNVNALDSYAYDYYEYATYVNVFFDQSVVVTGALSVSTRTSVASGFSSDLPYVKWWYAVP